ncbi:MAG: transporter substrate-binding domain-containing protein, partial [Gammaproteobacteria bacterium]
MILKIAVLILTLSLPLFASEHFSLSNRYLPPALPHPQQKFFSRIPLDPAEVDFLNSIDHIRMCVDPDWMPYDHIDDHGKYLGINADFHAVFRQRIGKPIRVVKTNSWNLSLDYIKRRQCDILSSAVLTEERKPFLAFTRPFNTSPIVIATRTDRQPIQYLEDVPGESFAMVKGHAVIDMLAKKHPGIRIVQAAHA